MTSIELLLYEASAYAVLAIIAFLAAERALRYLSRWPYVVRLVSGLKWAVTLVLLGYAIASVLSLLRNSLPQELGAYLSLALAIKAAVGAVAVEVSERAGLKGIGRITNAGLYLLGLLIAVQIFLRSHLAPRVTEFEWRVVNLVSGILVVYVVVAAIDLTLHRMVRESEGDRSFITAVTFLRRALVLLVGLLGLLAVLLVTFPEALGIAASSLIAAGFASIVIGLAAQSTLSNLISGLIFRSGLPPPGQHVSESACEDADPQQYDEHR